MAKFQFAPLVGYGTLTVRLGAGTGAANNLSDATERGKFVKLVAGSRYDLATVGSDLESWIESINPATADGYTLGAIADDDATFIRVTFDGLQGTPGTGTLAIGDYVVVGTPVAKGTVLTAPARVCKATDQALAKSSPFAWRVADLGSVGTGAVGTTGIIQRVC